MLNRLSRAGALSTSWRIGCLVTAGLVGFGLLLPELLVGQEPGPVHGVVADEATRQLIPSATVTLVGEGHETRSGADGTFAFPVAPVGSFLVRVEAPGYRAVIQEVERSEGRVLLLEVHLRRIEGNASLRVRVIDGMTERPLPGARVAFPELGLLTLADAEGGAFVTGISPGEYLLEVTMFGYGAAQAYVTFEPGSVAEGEVQLGTQPIVLEGITVTTTPRLSTRLQGTGFYDRARSGLGRHLDRAYIEEIIAFQPSDLFRSIPGVRRVPVGYGTYMIAGRRALPGFSGTDICPMQLYLDGLPWDGGIDGSIDDLPLDWIEGLEIYSGIAQVPAQYLSTRGNTTCGVVLIWTR